jgi:hypothetical protein
MAGLSSCSRYNPFRLLSLCSCRLAVRVTVKSAWASRLANILIGGLRRIRRYRRIPVGLRTSSQMQPWTSRCASCAVTFRRLLNRRPSGQRISYTSGNCPITLGDVDAKGRIPGGPVKRVPRTSDFRLGMFSVGARGPADQTLHRKEPPRLARWIADEEC